MSELPGAQIVAYVALGVVVSLLTIAAIKGVQRLIRRRRERRSLRDQLQPSVPTTWWRFTWFPRWRTAAAELRYRARRASYGIRFGRPTWVSFSERYQGSHGIPRRYWHTFGGRLTFIRIPTNNHQEGDDGLQ